jgi:hypothetical protein
MKSITNESLQAFQIFLRYPKGVQSMFIKPKETVVVPGSAITQQCEVMASRKILKIRTV